MLTKAKRSGICSSCRYGDECTYQKDPERPVIQCEEFATCEAAPAKTVKRSIRPSMGASARHELGGKDSGFKGLCVDCEERETCTYPKPEGGVWHCEEYR